MLIQPFATGWSRRAATVLVRRVASHSSTPVGQAGSRSMSSSGSSRLLIEKDQATRIATLRMQNGPVNSLGRPFVEELTEALKELEQDNQVTSPLQAVNARGLGSWRGVASRSAPVCLARANVTNARAGERPDPYIRLQEGLQRRFCDDHN